VHCAAAQTAAHARNCTFTGEQTYRHDAVKHALAKALTRHCKLIGVLIEDNQMFVDRDRAELKMDISVEGGQMSMPSITPEGAPKEFPVAADAAKAAAIDVSLADPTAATCRKRCSHPQSGAGRATRDRAKTKNNLYLPHMSAASYTLIPFVLELFGTIGAHAQAFLAAAAVRESEVSEGATSVSRCKEKWRQRISVTLQRVVSLSLARCFSKTRQLPAAGGVIHAAPDITAHMRLRLLACPQPLAAVVQFDAPVLPVQFEVQVPVAPVAVDIPIN
jgi:hypothetical protein